MAQLRPFFGPTTLACLSLIKPTEWPLVKTQAIDFKEPFRLWFDDVLGVEDEAVLTQHGVIHAFILVDLFEEPEQLRRLVADFHTP